MTRRELAQAILVGLWQSGQEIPPGTDKEDVVRSICNWVDALHDEMDRRHQVCSWAALEQITE
jgi:hypothetical protein